MKKRYLVLQDGTAFEGYAFGAEGDSIGELIFSTSAVGYIETLTDPCHYGQIVMQTFPMIGNYGINEADFIGEPKLKGYVVREYCEKPSNFRSEYDIDTFLKNNNIPAIYGIDTRELTNIIRDGGIVNAIICDEIPDSLDEVKNFKIVDALNNTCAKEKSEYVPTGEVRGHVAVMDLGSSKYIELKLADKGYKVTLLPFTASADEILSVGADALVLTEGAGDPRENTQLIKTIAEIFGKIPMCGIGLGHQIMALSQGGEIEKLTYGHHGGNQPSRKADSHKTLITTQNHNFAVKEGSVKNAVVTFKNLNDGTVEGLSYNDAKAISYQFEIGADTVVSELLK
ncbi:MAG: carbamoyl phosphate synthase small subunit [Acutalibacteraceae bacterium]